MNAKEMLARVDHTLLKPEATWPQVQQLCDEAMRYGTASVCINTCYVGQNSRVLRGGLPSGRYGHRKQVLRGRQGH